MVTLFLALFEIRLALKVMVDKHPPLVYWGSSLVSLYVKSVVALWVRGKKKEKLGLVLQAKFDVTQEQNIFVQ